MDRIIFTLTGNFEVIPDGNEDTAKIVSKNSKVETAKDELKLKSKQTLKTKL